MKYTEENTDIRFSPETGKFQVITDISGSIEVLKEYTFDDDDDAAFVYRENIIGTERIIN